MEKITFNDYPQCSSIPLYSCSEEWDASGDYYKVEDVDRLLYHLWHLSEANPAVKNLINREIEIEA